MKLKVTQVILGIIVLLMLITVLFLTFQGSEDTVSLSEKVRSIAVNLGYTGSLKQFRSDIHMVDYFGVGLAVALFFHVMGWKKWIGAVVAAIFGLIDETIKGTRYLCSAGMKPGITRMWQVSGRSEITDFDEVVRLDQEYIENWSLLLDIKILLKTVAVVARGQGAE